MRSLFVGLLLVVFFVALAFAATDLVFGTAAWVIPAATLAAMLLVVTLPRWRTSLRGPFAHMHLQWFAVVGVAPATALIVQSVATIVAVTLTQLVGFTDVVEAILSIVEVALSIVFGITWVRPKYQHAQPAELTPMGFHR